MINNEIYQIIYDEISDLVKTSWDKLVIYLEYGANSYSFAFYVFAKGKYTKCYDINDISDKELDETFRRIDDVVAPERNLLKDKWSNMTIIISSEGDMHTDFDYSDLSKGTYQYKKGWKAKYLV